MMIQHVTWSEKARMQLNAEQTKIMCFHETTQSTQYKGKTTENSGEKCLASTIPHPVHVSGLYKSLYKTAHVPRIPIYTPARSNPD